MAHWNSRPFGEGIMRHDAVLVEIHVQDVRALPGLTVQYNRPVRLLPVEVRESLSVFLRLDVVRRTKPVEDVRPGRLANHNVTHALFLDRRPREVPCPTASHDPPGDEQDRCRGYEMMSRGFALQHSRKWCGHPLPHGQLLSLRVSPSPRLCLPKATQIGGKGCATRSLVSSHRGNQGLTSQVEVCRGRRA